MHLCVTDGDQDAVGVVTVVLIASGRHDLVLPLQSLDAISEVRGFEEKKFMVEKRCVNNEIGLTGVNPSRLMFRADRDRFEENIPRIKRLKAAFVFDVER